MPVVGLLKGHIMGVVTYDDIMDIIHEEASADMLGMVGAGPEKKAATRPLGRESVRKRFACPGLWSICSISALSASVVYMFDGTIEQMAVLRADAHGGQPGRQYRPAIPSRNDSPAGQDRFDAKKPGLR